MRYFLKQSKIKKGLYLQIYELHYVLQGNRNHSYKTLGISKHYGFNVPKGAT